MKTLITILALTLYSGLHAQWYPVNSNTTENLNDILFVDSLTGYCVGGGDEYGFPEGNGVILKTTDGGENWTTIFTQDSLAIQHIAIVEENNYTKLYGFALKNGASYLITTFLSSQFQNWIVEAVSFRAKDVQIYDNVIYFMDETDQTLKVIQNSLVGDILADISIFYVINNAITYLNDNVDSVFVSPLDGNSVQYSNALPSEMSQNQITYAQVASFDDTIVVKGTYPGLVTKSNNQGLDWTTHYLAPNFVSEIISSQVLFGMDNLNRIQVTTNSGESWQIQDSLGVKIRCLYFYTDNLGFAVGENGVIFKTTNGGGTTSLKDIKGLKKKIKIYPNPSGNKIKISLPEGIKVNNLYLTNYSGQKVDNLSPNQEVINLSKFNSGVYFLVIETDEGMQTKKIVVGK